MPSIVAASGQRGVLGFALACLVLAAAHANVRDAEAADVGVAGAPACVPPGPAPEQPASQPRPRLSEEVTVTASRGETRLGDEAARVVVLDAEALFASPALRLDDVLRGVPGFSLFRRSGSRVANPTAQGVSLRGVGPSGASRALVLLDGVPQNDAFGGWVYWSRLPRLGLERVEVYEGGASSLYGSSALGGVIQAIPRAGAPALAIEALAGDHRTGAASLYAAARRRSWDARVSGEAFATGGFVLVSEAESGPVDRSAGSSHWTGTLTLDRRVADRGSVFARVSGLAESRRNGTPLQVNDTGWWQVAAGLNGRVRRASVALRAWRGTQVYHQTFSAIRADRSSETLTLRQRVPSTEGGFSLTVSPAGGARQRWTLGADGGLVHGRSDETAFAAGNPASLSEAGGRTRGLAVFAEDRIAVSSRVLVSIGARLDHRRALDDSLQPTSATGSASSSERQTDRSETALSPRLSLVARPHRRLDLTAATYGAFRAPTLNELYRSFRVGNTITRANPELSRERLHGVEAGLRWTAADGRARARLLAFGAWVFDPVANVTLQVSPGLVTRQRRNLGRTRSLGLSADAEARLARGLRASLGYGLVDAVVESAPAYPALERLRVPQVPRHQASIQLRFFDPRRLELSIELRAASRQFEDDLNALPLRGYWTLDARLARRLGRGLEAFAAVENASGRRYLVGATPTATLGPPRLLHTGVRLGWGQTASSPR